MIHRRGTEITPGLAQEVETVLPIAVTDYEEFIPNEFRTLTNYTFIQSSTYIDNNNTSLGYYWKLFGLADYSTTNTYKIIASFETTFDYTNSNNRFKTY